MQAYRHTEVHTMRTCFTPICTGVLREYVIPVSGPGPVLRFYLDGKPEPAQNPFRAQSLLVTKQAGFYNVVTN